MADVYVDSTLATGLNDGTSWANAYQSIITALNGTNVVSGDDVWWQNGETTTAAVVLTGGQTVSNPVKVYGVLDATTAEPPATADLIPGFRTGADPATEADAAYNDAGIPSLTNTSASNDIKIDRAFYFYGCKFVAADEIWPGSSNIDNDVYFEECYLAFDTLRSGSTSSGAAFITLYNCQCELQLGNEAFAVQDTGVVVVNGGKITSAAGANTGIWHECHRGEIKNCDLSDQSHTLLKTNASDDADPIYMNCKLHASTVLASASLSDTYAVKAYGCSSATGKGTGATFQEFDMASNAGVITEETTVVRTGGATDGATGTWSYAMTPAVDGTRDGFMPLIGEWQEFYFEGDGTAQTVNVFICNSASEAGANLYQDNDISLEVESPSAAGTAQWDVNTTIYDLQGTPANVTTDGSTWGAGGNNKQVLQQSISGDYTGILRCRVKLFKNYGASPVTAYIDPRPTVT